jgi:NAD(P)H-dependent flavin oxidoreductase YrpB (nitropropane dioxygenase family)
MGDPLATVLCERLGCRWPIVQTAMGWVSTPPLVIASCEAGAFGFLAGAVMTPTELKAAIAEVKAATDRTFGVNFHMFQPGAAEIIDLIVAEKIKAVSFGRGPDAAMIRRLRSAGVICMPTVGALKHAIRMADLGCDLITVQGGEGGGHTGPVATTVLLPQVLDAVKIPVVAAGGFADGRGLAAALAYGAAGVAMGTRFLLTAESPVPAGVKARYLEADADAIVVSPKVDGVPQRMLRNARLATIERSGPLARLGLALGATLEMRRATGASVGQLLRAARGMTGAGDASLAQAMMAAVAPMLIQKAVVGGDPEGGLMASGQVAGRIADLPTCRELVDRMVAEARARLAALSDGPRAPALAQGRG